MQKISRALSIIGSELSVHAMAGAGAATETEQTEHAGLPGNQDCTKWIEWGQLASLSKTDEMKELFNKIQKL